MNRRNYGDSLVNLVGLQKQLLPKNPVTPALVGCQSWEVQLIQYIKDTQKTTVRKNVSIPSWLNELGKNYNLNFSNLLQEAIKKELDID